MVAAAAVKVPRVVRVPPAGRVPVSGAAASGAAGWAVACAAAEAGEGDSRRLPSGVLNSVACRSARPGEGPGQRHAV